MAVQVALLVATIVTLSRRLLLPRCGWLAALVFGAVATLDPLNETYARFWLSDVPASAMFGRPLPDWAATGLASIVLLLRARRLEAIHPVCAGLLASLLYSHLVKPRYDLCTVTLAELLVVMLLFRWRATRQ